MRFGWCAMLCCALGAAGARAASDVTPQEVFRQWTAERERARSGVYHAKGGVQGADSDVPLEVFCAFDYDQGLLRFDRHQATVYHRDASNAIDRALANPRLDKSQRQSLMRLKNEQSETDETTARSADVRDFGFRLVRTPDESITWILGDQVVQVGTPDQTIPSGARFFDWRGLGLMSQFGYNSSRTFRDVLKAIVDNVNEFQVEPLGGSLLRLRRDFQGQNARMDIVVDNVAPFAPRKFVLQVRRSDDADWENQFEAETTWEELQGISVPRSHVTKLHGAHPSVVDLEFEWLVLNAEIPRETFQLEGMSLPPETNIVNTQLDEPVTLGTVGLRGIEEADPFGVYDSEESVLLQRTVILTAIAGVVLLGVVVWRRHVRRDASA